MRRSHKKSNGTSVNGSKFPGIEAHAMILFDALCSVEDIEEAEIFVSSYAGAIKKSFRLSEKESLEFAKKNIGYLMGYGAPEKIKRLFKDCFHPVLDLNES